MQSLVDRILNRNSGPAQAFCGERLVAQLPPEVLSAGGLRIVGPDTSRAAANPAGEASGGRYGELSEEGAGVVWNWHSPDRPGVYRVCRDPQPGVPGAAGTPATVFAQAIEIPAEESDLEYLSPKEIQRLAAGREIYFAARRRKKSAATICGSGSPWPAWFVRWAN